MRINIVSTIKDSADPQDFWSYNQIVAYSLSEALRELGHETVLVDESLETKEKGVANHTVVTSSKVLQKIRVTPGYYKKLRASTAGCLCLWLDSDWNGWYSSLFDRILVVCRQHSKQPTLFRYVGWAANPTMFKPKQQKNPAVYVDTYMTGFYNGCLDHVYTLIDSTLKHPSLKGKVEVFQPITHYNNGRVKWPAIAEYFCLSSFHIVTQPAFWGLTNIEAATAGALLLVHKDLVAPKTWPSPLRHCIYSSADELTQLLQQPVDVEANRRLAAENTWQKVAERCLEAFNC